VSVYDIRYSLVSCQFRHKDNNPVLALAHCASPRGRRSANGQPSGPGYALVSTGSSHYELSQMNLEDGKVEVHYRSGEPANTSHTYSEFIKETRY